MCATGPASVTGGRARTAVGLEWLLVWTGLATLYVPTLYRLVTEVWIRAAQAHGPVILLLSLWLIYRQWSKTADVRRVDRPVKTGWAIQILAVLVYVLGRSQHILLFEIGSVPLTIGAVLLLKCGPRTLYALWFPLFFMIFMIPLQESLIVMLTMPLKMAVSFVTEKLLYALGYPIGRRGVILQIGSYQLLVADACAGLQTVLTLEGMGLFYLNVTRHTAALRNVVLALLIVPISFAANVVRVMLLVLVTYYFGDAVGQGFMHNFAGVVLFVIALLLVMAIDKLMQIWLARRGHSVGGDAACV